MSGQDNCFMKDVPGGELSLEYRGRAGRSFVLFFNKTPPFGDPEKSVCLIVNHFFLFTVKRNVKFQSALHPVRESRVE